MVRPIVFLSDFGLKDPYVGQVKGMIYLMNPQARILDLTHNIKPFCITCGAYVLYSSIEWFPKNTVFLAVVDPGVGSSRKAIIVEKNFLSLVGPDNGLFWPIIEKLGLEGTRVFSINVERLGVPRISSTFHGRDVFGPAAALLSKNVDASEIGTPLSPKSLVRLILFDRKELDGMQCYRIIYVDRFGNMALSGKRSDIEDIPRQSTLNIQRLRDGLSLTVKRVETFSEVNPGDIALYVNSFGFIELSMYMGNLYKRHDFRIGDWVCLKSPT
jgi:S-adenosylmethionine hydrolase